VCLQISELSLSGNQMRADMQRGRLRFQAGDSLTNSTRIDGCSGGSDGGAGVDGGELGRLRAGAEIIDCRSESGSSGIPLLPLALLSLGCGQFWLLPVGL
jgi:hypothetical protein